MRRACALQHFQKKFMTGTRKDGCAAESEKNDGKKTVGGEPQSDDQKSNHDRDVDTKQQAIEVSREAAGLTKNGNKTDPCK
jgi:hypothetical protein